MMNSYQLISKLSGVRAGVYLTATDQALFHELVAVCNAKRWQPVFEVKSSVLCAALNITDKTLCKSRRKLAESGLLFFRTCSDKRVGCRYSFIREPPGAGDPADPATAGVSSATGAHLAGGTSGTTRVEASHVAAGTPIIDIKTINKEEAAPSPGEGGLAFPFDSARFRSAWEMLRATPKWRKKQNYALQLSLDKLGRFEEEFAIEQIERAAESNWTGVVFPGTEDKYAEWLNRKYGNNRKISKADKAGCLLAEYASLGKGGGGSRPDEEVLDF